MGWVRKADSPSLFMWPQPVETGVHPSVVAVTTCTWALCAGLLDEEVGVHGARAVTVAPSGSSSSKAPLRRILPKTDRSVCIPPEQCPEPADRQVAAHLIQETWGGEGNLKTLASGFCLV